MQQTTSADAWPLARVVVVGGLGFIGSRVVHRLRACGATVVVVDRCSAEAWPNPEHRAAVLAARRRIIGDSRLYQIDGANTGEIRSLLMEFRPHVLVHLANVPVASVVAANPVEATVDFMGTTASLLVAARDAEVGRFVYVSSSMVYGDFHEEPVAECHPTEPAEPYGALKLSCEGLVRSFTRAFGLPHTIVRPTAVYGPRGNPGFVIARFLTAAGKGGPMTVHGPHGRLDFTFVDDAAAGVVLAALREQGRNETFNISHGSARGILEAARLIQSRFPGSTIELRDADPLYPRRGSLSIRKAEELLGYSSAFSLERGLEMCLADD